MSRTSCCRVILLASRKVPDWLGSFRAPVKSGSRTPLPGRDIYGRVGQGGPGALRAQYRFLVKGVSLFSFFQAGIPREEAGRDAGPVNLLLRELRNHGPHRRSCRAGQPRQNIEDSLGAYSTAVV